MLASSRQMEQQPSEYLPLPGRKAFRCSVQHLSYTTQTQTSTRTITANRLRKEGTTVFKPPTPPRQKMNIKVANKLEKVIDRILTVMGSVFTDTGDSVQFRTSLSNALAINIPLLQYYGMARINSFSYLEFTNVSCHFYVQRDTYADSLSPSRIREIKDLFMNEAMKETYANSDRIFIEADFERCQDKKNIVTIHKFGSLRLDPPLALKQTS